MNFAKYHGLGNEYIVIDKKFADFLSKDNIIRICDVHFGVGSDGILLADLDKTDGKFAVKIFNPDGGEAEKSGNGLRIFSRYLFDCGLVKLGEEFKISTLGGLVKSTVIDENLVKVEMGKVSFFAINEKISVLDEEFSFCEANVGNPHCVIVLDKISCEIAKKYGSVIETDKRFVNRTNVQFVKIIDRRNIEIQIWERGAGYTLASGSSSTAAAAVAKKLGHCDSEITVSMAGGKLQLCFDEDFNATMSGAVQKICTGEITAECFADF
ncbi:MAG: diaminopimelate epimerase [Chitinivibrionia bacterium]|nr:diaminopimelate epimerase [Chitinivibrionia bacterium]